MMSINTTMSVWMRNAVIALLVTCSLTVDVWDAPVFKSKPGNQLAATGDDVTMTCNLLEEDDLTVNWRRGDGAALPAGRYKIQPNRSLLLKELKPEDEGVYVCVASNSFGTSEASAKLTIHSPPTFVTKPRNKWTVVGKTIKLRCSITGKPVPSLFWSKKEMLLFQNQKQGRYTVDPEGNLHIENAQEDDSGTYECNGLSTAGSVKYPAHLKVIYSDPTQSCKDWRGRTVFEGERFYPNANDVCFRCRCLNATAQHCKARSCSPPTEPCAIWQKVPDECCRYTCIQKSFTGDKDRNDNKAYVTPAPEPEKDVRKKEPDSANSLSHCLLITMLMICMTYMLT